MKQNAFDSCKVEFPDGHTNISADNNGKGNGNDNSNSHGNSNGPGSCEREHEKSGGTNETEALGEAREICESDDTLIMTELKLPAIGLQSQLPGSFSAKITDQVQMLMPK